MTPSWRTIALAGLLTALAAALIPVDDGLQWWGLAAAGLGLPISLDALNLVWKPPRPTLTRSHEAAWPLGRWRNVRLHFDAGKRPIRGWLKDAPDSSRCEASGLPAALACPAGAEGEIVYQLRPTLRGHLTFESPYLRASSPWGFWQRTLRIGEPSSVPVYPDFSRIPGAGLLGSDHLASTLGMLQRQRRGEGQDFHQMRAYQIDDPAHRIDWKATARIGDPVVREFQDERDQQILFMLDCGHRMRASDGEISHFDQSLNAMLLLAWLAQSHGDAIGLATFGGDPRWRPPRKGPSALNALIDASFDLYPTPEFPDHSAAVQTVLHRQRRRALIVMLTNTRADDADELVTSLETLGRQHLVLMVNLREPVVDECARQRVNTVQQALQCAAAQHFLGARARVQKRLRAQGLQVLDQPPEGLHSELINQYLAYKRAHMI